MRFDLNTEHTVKWHFEAFKKQHIVSFQRHITDHHHHRQRINKQLNAFNIFRFSKRPNWTNQSQQQQQSQLQWTQIKVQRLNANFASIPNELTWPLLSSKRIVFGFVVAPNLREFHFEWRYTRPPMAYANPQHIGMEQTQNSKIHTVLYIENRSETERGKNKGTQTKREGD